MANKIHIRKLVPGVDSLRIARAHRIAWILAPEPRLLEMRAEFARRCAPALQTHIQEATLDGDAKKYVRTYMTFANHARQLAWKWANVKWSEKRIEFLNAAGVRQVLKVGGFRDAQDHIRWSLEREGWQQKAEAEILRTMLIEPKLVAHLKKNRPGLADVQEARQ